MGMMDLEGCIIMWCGARKMAGWLTHCIIKSSLKMLKQENKLSCLIVLHNFLQSLYHRIRNWLPLARVDQAIRLETL